jgi:hypothetical protein
MGPRTNFEHELTTRCKRLACMVQRSSGAVGREPLIGIDRPLNNGGIHRVHQSS